MEALRSDAPQREIPLKRDARTVDPKLSRYSRQILYEPFGEEGQRRIMHAQAVIVGCGALGGVLANTLVRAGVGFVRVIDRDFIEIDNLQRQVLFDEQDIADNLPKAEAAARKLRRVNSAVAVDGIVSDVTPENIEAFCRDADILLDGTDNFETRFLINDVAVKHNIPWIYGACIAAEGLVMPIIPGETPCLRCIWEDAPPAGMTPTCDTAGILGPVVGIVASMQAFEALKLLSGRTEALNRNLVSIDAWSGRVRNMNMQAAREKGDCPCCRQRKFEFLEGGRASASTTLCGRNAVQITPAGDISISFKQLAARLPFEARPRFNSYMLRFAIEPYAITLFPDGRAIIKGTNDPAAARTFYNKYIGG